MLKEECDCQSIEAQTKKSRTPRLLAYVKWTFHSEGREGVKWELGFAFFRGWEMGFCALGLGFMKKNN